MLHTPKLSHKFIRILAWSLRDLIARLITSSLHPSTPNVTLLLKFSFCSLPNLITNILTRLSSNRPFPSYFVSHDFHIEFSYKKIHLETILIRMKMKLLAELIFRRMVQFTERLVLTHDEKANSEMAYYWVIPSFNSSSHLHFNNSPTYAAWVHDLLISQLINPLSYLLHSFISLFSSVHLRIVHLK